NREFRCRGMIGNRSQAQIKGDIIPGGLPDVAEFDCDHVGSRDDQLRERQEVEVPDYVSLAAHGLNSSRAQFRAVQIDSERISNSPVIVRTSRCQQKFFNLALAGQKLAAKVIDWFALGQ